MKKCLRHNPKQKIYMMLQNARLKKKITDDKINIQCTNKPDTFSHVLFT